MSPTNALLHRYEVKGKNIRLLGSARVFFMNQTFPRFSPTCFTWEILIYQKCVQIQVILISFYPLVDEKSLDFPKVNNKIPLIWS